MLGKNVEIVAENNVYTDMRGWVIEEFPEIVRIEIGFVDRIDKVMFYKSQVKVIN